MKMFRSSVHVSLGIGLPAAHRLRQRRLSNTCRAGPYQCPHVSRFAIIPRGRGKTVSDGYKVRCSAVLCGSAPGALGTLARRLHPGTIRTARFGWVAGNAHVLIGPPAYSLPPASRQNSPHRRGRLALPTAIFMCLGAKRRMEDYSLRPKAVRPTVYSLNR